MCYKLETAGVSAVMAPNVEAQLSTCHIRKESLEGFVSSGLHTTWWQETR